MKANSRKQIINKIKKVDTKMAFFEKAIKQAYGETKNIKVESCHTTYNVSNIGECPTYIAFDESEDGYTKTIKFAAQRYEKDNAVMMKVVKILSI